MSRIATIQELSPFVGIHDESQMNEDLLQLFLNGAEAFAERWTGRTFSPDPPLINGVDSGTPVAKKFTARGKGRLIRIPDLREATSTTLDGTALTRDTSYYYDAYVEPANWLELVTPFVGSTRGEIVITGRWGFNPALADAKMAVLTLAARAYRRRDANFSDAQQTSGGSQFFWSQNMPQEVAEVFRSLRTPNLAVV